MLTDNFHFGRTCVLDLIIMNKVQLSILIINWKHLFSSVNSVYSFTFSQSQISICGCCLPYTWLGITESHSIQLLSNGNVPTKCRALVLKSFLKNEMNYRYAKCKHYADMETSTQIKKEVTEARQWQSITVIREALMVKDKQEWRSQDIA